jgi:hypothetical protein
MSTQPAEAPQQTPTDPTPASQTPQNPPPNPQPQSPPPAPSNPNPDQAARVASDATRNLLDARSLQDLRNEIRALPERIVNGIREATQPPQPTSSGGGSGNGGTPTGGAANSPTPGKRTSFADWWFNG